MTTVVTAALAPVLHKPAPQMPEPRIKHRGSKTKEAAAMPVAASSLAVAPRFVTVLPDGTEIEMTESGPAGDSLCRAVALRVERLSRGLSVADGDQEANYG